MASPDAFFCLVQVNRMSEPQRGSDATIKRHGIERAGRGDALAYRMLLSYMLLRKRDQSSSFT